MVSTPRALPHLKRPAGARRIDGVPISGRLVIGKRAEKIRLCLQLLHTDK